MQIVWDEHKRRANRDKHGFDFADLTLGFFEESFVERGHSGRLTATGPFGNKTVTVVFVYLGDEALSVISMRRASKKERAVLR